ncbi:MAG: TetR/AcrR family transcriptional regulator [Chloroflexi bacterium]|nr:TetR/AcrR family transcriptional regulator [Chloroflexota bacterium]
MRAVDRRPASRTEDQQRSSRAPSGRRQQASGPVSAIGQGERRGGGRPTAPATRQGAETRERLVEAAIDEILERGFVRARVESITRRAGLGYGTFYWYFSSKVDLIRELAESVYGEIYDAAVAHEPDPERPVVERAFNNILASLRVWARYRRALTVLEDAVGADRFVALRVQQLQRRAADRYAEKLSFPIYHPVDDRLLIARLASAVGYEVARFWAREAANDELLRGEQGLQRVARIAAMLNLALVDPRALGVSEEALRSLLPGARVDQDKGASQGDSFERR